MEVHDSFIPDNLMAGIKNVILGPSFPWYYCSTVVKDNDNDLKQFQLTHKLYSQNRPVSQFFDVLQPLIDQMGVYSLLSCKANLNMYAGEGGYEHGLHTDISYFPEGTEVTTAVFYLNTNNGYTYFESSGEKVYSVENRLVTFPSTERHTGSNPTDVKGRYVLNINYIKA